MKGETTMLETSIAGSLPKPAWLAEPESLWAPTIGLRWLREKKREPAAHL